VLGGSNPGYRSNIAFFPDDDLVVAQLANIHVTDLPSTLPFYIADGILGLPKTEDWMLETLKNTQETYDIYAKLFANDIPDRVEGRPYNHQLADYAGEYTHPVQGKVTVTLDEESSSLSWRIRTLGSKLEHYHYESFKGVAHDFAMKGDLLFTFQTDSKGVVNAVNITLLMGEAPEVFKKIESPEPATSKEE